MEYNKIYQGDVLEVLKTFPDECVDLIITSPPYYGLRNYGVDKQIGLEESFEEYLNKLLLITKELKRVLKKAGQLWWNHGDSYGGLPAGNKKISDANIGTDGVFVRKMKMNEGAKSFVNSKKIKRNNSLISKCFLLQPERLAIKMIDEQGWILRNKVIWAKQVLIKKENRTIGTSMPTSVKDRLNETWEYFYFFTKNRKYYSNLDTIRIPHQYWGIVDNRPTDLLLGSTRQKGGGYLNSKYNKFDFRGNSKVYNLSLRNSEGRFNNLKKKVYKGKFKDIKDFEMFNSPRAREMREEYNSSFHPLGKNIPTIWQINPEPHNFQKELGVNVDHFAVFPEALVEIPIKFGCPENGVVLDPFAGSGTTLVVAKRLGRKYLGIELNEGYIEIAKRRLEKTIYQLKIEVASK